MKRGKAGRLLVWLLIFVMLMQNTVYAAGWKQENSHWYYEQNGTNQTGWINDGTGLYHLDANGSMQTGWYQENQIWYFLNPVHDGYYGRAFSNQWAWIDGYCYSFGADGKMYANCITPDGYEVNAEGKWTVNGVVQYVAGKGILTAGPALNGGIVAGGALGAGGSGGGGGGGGSSSGGGGGGGSSSGGSGSSGGSSSTALPEVEGIEFAKGVKAASLVFEQNEDDKTITIPGTNNTNNFVKGQIYILHNEGDFGGDIAVKVTDVKKTAGGTQLSYEEPELAEVVDSVHISGTETSECEFIPAEGVTVTSAESRMARSAGIKKLNGFNGFDIRYKNAEISFAGNFRLDSVVYQFNADKENGVLNIGDCKLVLNSTFKSTINYTKKEEKKTRKEIPFGKLRIPINAVAWLEGSVRLVVETNGHFGITYSLDSQTGVEYTKADGLRPICILNPDFYEVHLGGGLKPYAEIPTNLKIFGLKACEVGGDIGIDITSEFKVENPVLGLFCMDAKIRRFVVIYAQLGPDGPEDEEADFPFNIRGEFPIDSKVLKNLHIEETGLVPKCTREGAETDGVYQGTVKDSVTKKLISNAKIETINKDGVVVETIYADENGKYNGNLLPAGTYALRVSCEGYITSETDIKITKGETTDTEIFLTPTSWIPPEERTGSYEGYVKAYDGLKPIKNALIEVSGDDGNVVDTVYTDGYGYYKGKQLRTGTYTLRISATDYISSEDKIVIYENQTANTTTLLDAVATTPEPGTGSFWGRVGKRYGWDTVVNDEGVRRFVPVSGVKVELMNEKNTVVKTLYTDDTGYFEGTCPEGLYGVILSHEDYYTNNSWSFDVIPGISINEGRTTEMDFSTALDALKIPIMAGVAGKGDKADLIVEDSEGNGVAYQLSYYSDEYHETKLELLPGDYTLIGIVDGAVVGTRNITITREGCTYCVYRVPESTDWYGSNSISVLCTDNVEPESPSDAEQLASPSNAEEEPESEDIPLDDEADPVPDEIELQETEAVVDEQAPADIAEDEEASEVQDEEKPEDPDTEERIPEDSGIGDEEIEQV